MTDGKVVEQIEIEYRRVRTENLDRRPETKDQISVVGEISN